MHTRKRFLVISSDAVGRDLLSVSLKRHGGAVWSAATVGEAPQALANEAPFDAAFLDIRQNSATDEDACAQVVSHKASGQVRHVICIVERNDLERRRVIHVSGADALVVWPPEDGDVERVLELAERAEKGDHHA